MLSFALQVRAPQSIAKPVKAYIWAILGHHEASKVAS